MLEEYLKLKADLVDEKLLEFLPKMVDEIWIKENLGNHIDNDLNIINEILKPVWDLLDRGGKRWRPILMLLACDAVGGGSKIEDLIPLVEIIHNGTLMIDDVEDNSDLRRGKPCIHKIFGKDVAINTGNLMYYLPYLILKNIDLDKKTKLSIYELIFEEMLNISIGQGMDIYWHNGGNNVSEKLYLKMCGLKTGTLAKMSAKLGALVGNASKRQIKALGKFAETIGVAFQIQDDILNITNESWGKDFGEDITEGKKTLMVIRVLEKGKEEDKRRLDEILNMKTKEKELIFEAISIINHYNAIEYAKRKAKKIVESSWDNLEPYLENSNSKMKLKLFAEFLINRKV
jgi:geranylgeranyl diphosphate synthase, type I